MDLNDYLDARKCNWTVRLYLKFSVTTYQALRDLCCTYMAHSWGTEGRGVKQVYKKRLMQPHLSACSENCGSPVPSGLLIVVSQMGGFPSYTTAAIV